MRNRVSIADSAAGSANSTTRRKRTTPIRPARVAARPSNPGRSTSRNLSTMSTATTASTKGSRWLRSAIVRRIDIAGNPWRGTTSSSASAARRTDNPARADTPHPGGTATSTGSQGGRSRPCSQAAVRPAKTAVVGRRHWAALRTRSGHRRRPAHTSRPRANAMPACTPQVLPSKPGSMRLGHGEGPARELSRNHRLSWHGPEDADLNRACAMWPVKSFDWAVRRDSALSAAVDRAGGRQRALRPL